MDKPGFLMMWILLTAIMVIPTIVGSFLFGAWGLIGGFTLGGVCITMWAINRD